MLPNNKHKLILFGFFVIL